VEPINAAIVGYGELAHSVYAHALRRIAALRVVAIADPEESRRALAATQFSGVDAYADWRDALKRADVRAVIVATPPRLHASVAVAALERGLHVYVEKPLATDPLEAEFIREAARKSGSVAMCGFNYRFNPPFVEARERVRKGEIGDVTAVRTRFATANSGGAALRRSAAEGGGAILDLGSHHFDLLPWLLDDEPVEVRGESGSAVTIRFRKGAVARCEFSLNAAPEHVVEIQGSAGAILVDCYHWPGLRIAGRPLRNALAAIGRTPFFIEKRRSPWRDPSWGLALRAFAGAIAAGQSDVTPSIADGCRSLEIAMEAVDSASMAGPSAPAPQSRDLDLSVILVTLDNFESIRTTVRCLAAQSIADRMELVIVCPKRDELGLDPHAVAAFGAVQALEDGASRSPAGAKAHGIRNARAAVVALAEDHSYPEAGWAEALVEAHRGDCAAVGPEIVNANPENMVSWSDFYIGYGPWASPARGGAVEHIPGHNSSYKRELLLEFGERLDFLLDMESVLHWELRDRGHRLLLEPRARTRHVNFSLFGSFVTELYMHGRMFASVRAERWPLWKRVVYCAAGPLIPLVRLRRVLAHIAATGRTKQFTARILPVLCSGLALNGLGEMLGYIAGPGDTGARFYDLEFHRERYVAGAMPNPAPEAAAVKTASAP